MIEFQKEDGVYASHCRFTNCVMDDCNDPDKSEKPVKGVDPITVSEYWLGLHGKNIRIDHCYFANKRIGGLILQIWLNEYDHLIIIKLIIIYLEHASLTAETALKLSV